jgi:hypothetical protein
MFARKGSGGPTWETSLRGRVARGALTVLGGPCMRVMARRRTERRPGLGPRGCRPRSTRYNDEADAFIVPPNGGQRIAVARLSSKLAARRRVRR